MAFHASLNRPPPGRPAYGRHIRAPRLATPRRTDFNYTSPEGKAGLLYYSSVRARAGHGLSARAFARVATAGSSDCVDRGRESRAPRAGSSVDCGFAGVLVQLVRAGAQESGR